ncbi:hypothetical protein VDG1235_2917 [Verrucomicrobiia bacterium DG1235]|nr:hypothetical protein VDG1235_2917 [Verrucomicrobiae bacterium DG1235]
MPRHEPGDASDPLVAFAFHELRRAVHGQALASEQVLRHALVFN